MKIITTHALKVRIEDAPNLDPIDVFLEDHSPKHGSVTIKCYGQSWTTYWGGMWDGLTVAQFIQAAPAEYVVDRLWTGADHTEPDWDALEDKLKAEIIRSRRTWAISDTKARDLFGQADGMLTPGRGEPPDLDTQKLIEEVFDYCWWDHIPQRIKPEYDYLRRIVAAVREALSYDHKVPA